MSDTNYHHRLIYETEAGADAALDAIYDTVGGNTIRSMQQEYNPNNGITESKFGTSQPVEKETMDALEEQTGAIGYYANFLW